jgi:hypothetical protein
MNADRAENQLRRKSVRWLYPALTYFAIDSLMGIRYILASASGREWDFGIFENKQSVISIRQSAQAEAKSAGKWASTRLSQPYRMALWRVFATKVPKKGGGGRKKLRPSA